MEIVGRRQRKKENDIIILSVQNYKCLKKEMPSFLPGTYMAWVK